MWSGKGEHDKAIEFFNKALKINLVTFGENHVDTMTSYDNIGDEWNRKGEYDKAIEFFNKALKVNIERKDLFHIEANYRDIALACSYQKKYKKAIVFYSKSLEIWKYKATTG